MQTNEPTWQNAALKKFMELSIISDSKRSHILEIQSRIREVNFDYSAARNELNKAQQDFEFTDNSQAAKNRLKEAEERVAMLGELQGSLQKQAAQLTPSVTAAIRLTNACEQVLINLNVKKD